MPRPRLRETQTEVRSSLLSPSDPFRLPATAPEPPGQSAHLGPTPTGNPVALGRRPCAPGLTSHRDTEIPCGADLLGHSEVGPAVIVPDVVGEIVTAGEKGAHIAHRRIGQIPHHPVENGVHTPVVQMALGLSACQRALRHH